MALDSPVGSCVGVIGRVLPFSLSTHIHVIRLLKLYSDTLQVKLKLSPLNGSSDLVLIISIPLRTSVYKKRNERDKLLYIVLPVSINNNKGCEYILVDV